MGATSAFDEPVLAAHDIQGDGLAGFRKDHGAFLFLRIADVPRARRWIAWLAPQVATLAQVHAFNRLFRTERLRSGAPASTATWVNVCFTAAGLAQLTSEAEVAEFDDEPFRAGLAARSAGLGDPVDPSSPGHPGKWSAGGPETPVDLLVIVAGDVKQDVQLVADEIMAGEGAEGLELVQRHVAATRSDLPGHEHFGFRDGVSQPAVRGLMSEGDPDDFLSPRILDPSDARFATFAAPGQPLLWPGQFVFGERRESDDPEHPEGLDPVVAGPSWAVNGSYVVVRILRQRVVAFWRFVVSEAEKLARGTGFDAITPELLASKLVGRWPSGAPLMRAPAGDDPRVAKGLDANDFDYRDVTVRWRLRTGLRPPDPDVEPSPGDLFGKLCPHAAHIRKVNPRDQSTDLGGPTKTRARLMMRRGMPYGDPVPDPQHAAEALDDEERGLTFVSYQTSIERQFEFVQATWANQQMKPTPGGHDALIGQRNTGPRVFELPAAGAKATLALPDPFVLPTGGGYFFAPSIGTLRDRLGGGGG
jgi:Dyp-type peroxidase family